MNLFADTTTTDTTTTDTTTTTTTTDTFDRSVAADRTAGRAHLTSASTAPARGTVRPVRALAVGAVAALLLAGCASPDAPGTAGGGAEEDIATTTPATDGATGQDTTSPMADAASAGPLDVVDPWVRAVDQETVESDETMSMTSVFAELTNTTEEQVQIVDAESPQSEDVELHETVEDGTGSTVMREVEDGFTIPAGETYRLVPGGDHLMLMGLDEALEPGVEIEVTVELSDGQTQTMTAEVREYAGANETYEGTHGGTGEGTEGAPEGTDQSTDEAGDG